MNPVSDEYRAIGNPSDNHRHSVRSRSVLVSVADEAVSNRAESHSSPSRVETIFIDPVVTANRGGFPGRSVGLFSSMFHSLTDTYDFPSIPVA